MSQFDNYTTSGYVESLRQFLGMKKRNFQRDAGLAPADTQRRGRLPSYPEEAIANLESQVNAKAARAEATDSTLGERFQIARDYKGFTDASVSREMGVSRELVRRWGLDINKPSDLPRLAEVLDVPEAWLESGDPKFLPANSHVGVRVGEAAMDFREQLYGMTTVVLADLPENASDSEAQAFLERAVFSRPWLAEAARRSGGRWQIVQGALLFAPWVPIAEHGLTRRYWSDTVEAMIQEELASKPSVYAAWHSLKARCEAMNMNEDEYPKLISLHKRIEKERMRAEKFGVDLNTMIAESLAAHPSQPGQQEQ